MKARLARFDTLFVRLFLLLWITLVGSHFVAFSTVRNTMPAGGPPQGLMPPPPGERPGPPPGAMAPPTPTMGTLPPSDLPMNSALVDYGVRAAVMALAALLGARWLSAPMKRLSRAARDLSMGLGHGHAPPVLDEHAGTREVRDTARVFNAMAARLQEQFDARGMHMAALSHDLRTPLTRLRMRLEDAPPAVADGARADIHEMTEMMEGTLAVMREQREGRPPEPLDLRSLLEAIVDDRREMGDDVSLAAGGPAVAPARPAALRRIVDNLVGNALRYGGSAQLAITPDADGVNITVDDRGPGIPDAQLEQAFKPWVRLTTSHARSGHGLGLAIARDLAERDGGTLVLANRPQGGLRATLRLPATVSAPTSTA